MSEINAQGSISGNILRLERASIHDGQGLRTVLFLKGCPLRCPWCSTPESQLAAAQKGYDLFRCTICGKCIKSCPEGALKISPGADQVITNPDKCKLCFACAAVCPVTAVKKYGFQLTAAETLDQICKDEIFYFHSGGGLTISGGEPFMQGDFTAAVLRECKMLGIHTAIESCMHLPYDHIEKALPWLDHLYVDIKQMDSRLHQLWIGVDNTMIIENTRKADSSGYPVGIIVRIPLITGFNDSDQNLVAVAEFCSTLVNLIKIEILPYHRLGSETYRLLGLDFPCWELDPQSDEDLEERASFLKSKAGNIAVITGSGFSAK